MKTSAFIFLIGSCVFAIRTVNAAPFADPIKLALPRDLHPTCAAADDFNGDGIDDFAVAGEPQSMAIFLSDGRGGFSQAKPQDCGPHPSAIVAADLNGDKHLDIVVANHECDFLTLMEGDGAGGFKSRRVHVDSKPHPHAVAVGDFDGDGTPDIAVDSANENRLLLLLARDNWEQKGAAVEVGRKPYYTISAADLDGDGHVDLVVPNVGRGTVCILMNDSHGKFAHAPGSPMPAGPTPFSATIADMNGDKRPDILVANYSGHASDTSNDGLTWIRNDGERRFTPFTERVARGNYSARIVAGDVNHDGFADAIITNTNASDLTVVSGSKSGPAQSEKVATMPAPHALAIGDFNHDGRDDLVVVSESGTEAWVFVSK